MRRVIYSLSILVVIGVVVGVGYFLRYRAEEPEVPILGQLPTTPTQKTPAAPAGSVAPSTPGTSAPSTPGQPSLPQAFVGENKFGMVAQNNILNFFVGADNSVLFIEPGGKIGRIIRGETSMLSSSEIANLRRAEFSYDGKKILAEFGESNSPQYSVFDSESKSWLPLAQGIKAATWSSQNYEIAYLAEKGRENVLALLDTANSKAKPREIVNFNAEDLALSWPAPNRVLVREKSGASFAASVFEVDVKARTIKPLIPPRIGLEMLWNERADRGVIFVGGRNVRGGELGLVDESGTLLNRLAFLTLPRKCGFYEKEGAAVGPPAGEAGTSTPATTGAETEFLLCAIPKNRGELDRVPLPDAYEERSLYTLDDLYEINMKNGSVRAIYQNESVSIDGHNLKVFGKNLFFINRFDGKLYAVSLE